MFSRLTAFLPVVALVAVAAAAPNALEARDPCNTGSEYCCNQTFSNTATFTGVLPIGTLINVLLGAGIPIGLTCTPIAVAGVDLNGNCLTQTACCSGDQTGIVNVQCIPISA